MSTLENKHLLNAKKFVRSHLTSLMPICLRISSRLFTMPNERAYFLNDQRISESEEPSLILLSQPRAGTQVCEHTISSIYDKTGGISLKTGRFYFHYDASAGRKVNSSEWVINHVEQNGYFYGGMGPFSEVSSLPKVKYILMTRDPRDILISHYYSVKEAHVINSKKMLNEVNRVKSMSLTEYCADEYILKDLEKYLNQASQILASDLDYIYVKYESLIADPRKSLTKIGSFIGLSEDNLDLEDLLEANFKTLPDQDSEDILRHRRSGAWGQFREKLPAELQELLWDRFKDKMELLGYGKDDYEST